MKLIKRKPRNKEEGGLLVDTFAIKLVLEGEEIAHLSQERAAEIMNWGVENFGGFGTRWAFSSAQMRARNFLGDRKITAYFHTEADAMLFAMRWAHEL